MADTTSMSDNEYAEFVRQKIREGLESLRTEPLVTPEEAKKRAFEVIARVKRDRADVTYPYKE